MTAAPHAPRSAASDNRDDRPRGAPERKLSLLDSTSIIVGIIIGSGIYETTPFIASLVANPVQLIQVWLLGGLISLLGAMCYAELSTAYPDAGGDYRFLTRAFGPRVGFLFAWSEFWIIRPGNVGMMGFVFARYAQALQPLPPMFDRYAFLIYASAAVLLLTGVHLLGVRTGKVVQNVLTVGKVAALILICFVGLTGQPASPERPASGASGAAVNDSADAAPAPSSPTDSTNLRLAMVLVLFTYGGWNEMSYVAAEVRNPQRNILRALLLGTLAVTVIYMLANLAFLRALGFEGLRQTGALAADVLQPRFGTAGARIVSVCVCLSCLGAINGMLFTGSRIYYALGTEHPLFAWLGTWHGRLDSPVRSLLVQCGVTLLLVIGFGSYDQGFERLFTFTAPVFWVFIFMVGVGVFVLRRQRPATAIGYRVFGYPWTPVVFCLMCAFLFDSSFSYALSKRSHEATWAIAILLVGGLLSHWCIDGSHREPCREDIDERETQR